MVDAIRLIINEQRVWLPSEYLQNQLWAFGKRNGRKQKHQYRDSEVCDDGVDALAMVAVARHHHRGWTPKIVDIGLKAPIERIDVDSESRENTMLEQLLKSQRRDDARTSMGSFFG